MKIIESISALEGTEPGWALTIGNFDGVHPGHQEIIAAGRQAAEERGLAGLAVLTFDPHPAAVLHPARAPGILTPLMLKQHLLEALGVDCLIVLKDTVELLNLSPADFVDKFLMAAIRPSVVVEGRDFNFGYGRSGNVETLAQLGSERGFEVIVVEPRQVELVQGGRGGRVICSSSLVRMCLAEGRVAEARQAMGRFYRLIGKMTPGRGMGRQLGFPTANIQPLEQIVPAEGVYAGFVAAAETPKALCLQSSTRPAALSIGRAKTFVSDHPLLVEAHILEDDVEDLAGKWLAMDFVERLRPQRRFEKHEDLKQQIARDCQQAKQILDDIDRSQSANGEGSDNSYG